MNAKLEKAILLLNGRCCGFIEFFAGFFDDYSHSIVYENESCNIHR